MAKVEKDQLPTVSIPISEAGIARPTLDEKEVTADCIQDPHENFLCNEDGTSGLFKGNSKPCIPGHQVALHRHVAYFLSTTDIFMEGFVGDSFDDCQFCLFGLVLVCFVLVCLVLVCFVWFVCLFADADRAREFDSKSTSVPCFLLAPTPIFP